MFRPFAAAMAALACAGVAQAQPAAPADPGADAVAVLTLSAALALAGAHSPLVEASAADLRAADAARTVAGLRPNPSLSVELENFAGDGDYRGTRSAEATSILAFPIELGGKRGARIEGAEARLARARAQGGLADADLGFAVTRAYAEAVAAERRLGTVREQARIAADALHAARLRVKAGRASPLEEQRADVVRINADAGVEQAQRQQVATRARLARLIGAPVSAALDAGWFGAIPPALVPVADDTLALAVAEADVAVAVAEVRQQQAARLPDVELGAGVRRFRETGSTAALVSLSLPVPLFANGRAALAGARAQQQAAEARRRQTALELEQAVAEAALDLADASATAERATGPALAAAQEAARIARIGYANGKFGQLELLESERTLSETRLAAIEALLAAKIAHARLAQLTARAPSEGSPQ